MQNRKIVLCSASPRRQQLLKELGFEFETVVINADETFPNHLEASDVATFLAEKKADAFRKHYEEGKIYITADTIVSLTPTLSPDKNRDRHGEGEVLNKPLDSADAFSMLKKLSGNTHQVFTAVSLSSMKERKTICVKSNVRFKTLTDEEIKFYVEHYRPFDKAGSYGAQECLPRGMNPCSEEEKKFLEEINKPDLFERTLSKDKAHFPIIQSIEGSYFNVMGLPIVEVYHGILNS
jgi:septum formation protein